MASWWRGPAVALGIFALGGLLGFAALALQVDRLGRRDEARPGDVIVVLGARVEQDGRPSTDLAARIEHAVSLWKSGYAPNIICSGGIAGERLSAAAVCKRYAAALGVPGERVLLADGTSNTIEDAQAAARVMAAQGWRSAILVSHPLHLFRARWLIQSAGVVATTSPTSTATDRIDLRVRVYYAVREAGAIVATALNADGWLPPSWKSRLEDWAYRVP